MDTRYGLSGFGVSSCDDGDDRLTFGHVIEGESTIDIVKGPETEGLPKGHPKFDNRLA